MSIFSQLLRKQITWPEAEKKIETWFAGLMNGSGADADLKQAESDMKQAASNALGLADTAATTYLTPMVQGIEAAMDTGLTTATKGLAAPLIPLLNAGFDQIASTAHAAVDAAIAQARTALQAQAADKAAGSAAPAGAAASPPAPGSQG